MHKRRHKYPTIAGLIVRVLFFGPWYAKKWWNFRTDLARAERGRT